MKTHDKYKEQRRAYCKRYNQWISFNNKVKTWNEVYNLADRDTNIRTWRFIEVVFKRYWKNASADSSLIKYIKTSNMFKEMQNLWDTRFGVGSFIKLLSDE